MATFIPYINPVRIRLVLPIEDDSYVFPVFDSMTQRIEYQRGITPQSSWYVDFLINKKIEVIVYSTTVPFQPTIYLPDGTSDSMTLDDITPSAWTQIESIYKLSYTPSQVGLHYFTFIALDSYESDMINVKTGDKKDLVEFVYSDTENRYRGMFYEGATPIWEPRMYYTGLMDENDGETEQTLYTDEPGNQVLLETTESNGLIVTLTDIHNTYYKIIKQQRKCDTFFVNGVECVCLEISKENIDEKSDMINVIIKFAYANNDGFFNHE